MTLKKTRYILITLAFFGIAFIELPLLASYTPSESLKQEQENLKPRINAGESWVLVPTLDRKYFSPDTSPGVGDSVLYSFSIDSDSTYYLNVSAYYETIENYPGSGAGDFGSAAYLDEKGTWYVVLSDMKISGSSYKNYLMIGMGKNASDLEWKEVGEFNETEHVVVAANHTGSIRILSAETGGIDGEFNGILCYSSNDNGENWDTEEIADFSSFQNECFVNGMSLANFKENFTCILSVDNTGGMDGSTLWATHEDPINGWSTANNLTGLLGRNAAAPQAFYNQTNNNGTLFLAYNYFKGSNTIQNITVLPNGIDGKCGKNWTLFTRAFPGSYDSTPLAYCTKDNNSNTFYFLDQSVYSDTGDEDLCVGLQDVNSWGDNIATRPYDYFQPEIDNSFALFAINGPKCYSGNAENHEGYTKPGILDCKHPFNVRTISETATAYETETFMFNGKDVSGNSRNASAYSFNIHVGDLRYDSLVYVDDIAATLDADYNSNKISPFTSPGVNDEYKVDIESNKAGTATLNIRSSESTIESSNLTSGRYFISDVEMCGDGTNNYIFFTEAKYSLYYLMISKSSDGGLSWSTPEAIKSSASNQWHTKQAVLEGANIYLWTQGDYLFVSSDSGNSFTEYNLGKDESSGGVEAASDNLVCWKANHNRSNEFVFNRSLDYGYTWEPFINLTIENPENYFIRSAVYDSNTGNYSFLIINDETRKAFYCMANKDGTQIINSTDLFKTSISPYKFGIDLDLRVSGNTREFIITSTCVSMPDGDQQAYVAYKTLTRGVSFTEWKNYTTLTKEKIKAASFSMSPESKHWDILFPENADPNLVTAISFYLNAPVMGFQQLEVTGSSRFVFGKTEQLDSNYKATITFQGVSNGGDILDDGTYDWLLKLVDQSGYEISETGTLIIDNNDPNLSSYESLTNPSNAYPSDDVKVTIPINDANPESGILSYRITGEAWHEINMQLVTIDSSNANFTATIPKQDSDVKTVFWKAKIVDVCGNYLDVDNDGQLYSYGRGIYEYIKESGLLAPTLYDDWTWSYVFTSGMEHLSKVWVRKYYDGNLIGDTIISKSGTKNNTYSIDMAHQLEYSNATYKFMFQTDTGDTFTMEEILLKKPIIRLEEENDPPSSIDLNDFNTFNVSFSITEYNDYVAEIYIQYEYNDGAGIRTANLTRSGTLYKYVFENISQEVTQLNYTVIGNDTLGQSFSLKTSHLVKIIPALPNWEMTPEQQLIMAIVSLIVGVVCGVVYSELIERKKTERSVPEKLLKGTRKGITPQIVKSLELEKEESLLRKDSDEIVKKKNILALILTTVALAGCFTSGLIIFLILQIAEISMLLFTGSLLASIMLWVLLSNRSVEKSFQSLEEKSMVKEQLILSAIAVLIFISILTIFLAGNTLAWWRVRVNQLSYQLGGLVIPKALTTVSTTFFSSIFLLTWSTFSEVKKKKQELKESENLNENPLVLLRKRDEVISTITGNVGKKGIIFVALIGVTIIFASDLSVYANQGILVILPFAIGAIISLGIIMFLQRKKKKPIDNIDAIVLDNLIKCPSCSKETALGGNFCEKCGAELLTKKRFSQGIICDKCQTVNNQDSEHCRYCGIKLKFNKSQKPTPKKATKSDTNTPKSSSLKRGKFNTSKGNKDSNTSKKRKTT